jgi:CspA family cold shock protein
MLQGKVKWFDSKKGFGFILNPEGGEDIFVHFSEIISDLSYKALIQDDEVEFELIKTKKGLQAKSVRVLSKSNVFANRFSEALNLITRSSKYA